MYRRHLAVSGSSAYFTAISSLLANKAHWSCAMLCRYVKFDTFHPAVDLGLPVTRVISRVVLQKKLAEKAEEMEGAGVLANDCHVVDYEEVRPGSCCS